MNHRRVPLRRKFQNLQMLHWRSQIGCHFCRQCCQSRVKAGGTNRRLELFSAAHIKLNFIHFDINGSCRRNPVKPYLCRRLVALTENGIVLILSVPLSIKMPSLATATLYRLVCDAILLAMAASTWQDQRIRSHLGPVYH